MLKGGIYLYPPTKKDPKGKLRLLYECYPLAFIAEKSGGKASDGFGNILDIAPQSFHQRSPLYIGSAGLVDDVVKG
jgi:fructose-1,6-bisphosphatase I